MVLHVGLPKSGTTFLQRSLAANAEALSDRGVLYPQTREDAMFLAALDVRGSHKAWGRKRKQVEGAWDGLCMRARRQVGTTVISHELLAAASRKQAEAAMTMLKGLDVHLVVTARDPARQLVAEWQEGVKHGRQVTFAEFHAKVSAGENGFARRFQAGQDLPDVLDRWGRRLPPDCVHVVVTGDEKAGPDVLWRRFASVVGFDPTGFPAVDGRLNTSLGTPEIDLLRRVNLALDGRLVQPDYGRLVKHRLAQDLLAGRASPRPRLPLELYDELVPVAERWAKVVHGAGYTVHGDLADLVPTRPDVAAGHPDAVDPADQVDVAADVIAELLLGLRRAEEDAAAKDDKRRSWKKQAKKLRRRLAEA